MFTWTLHYVHVQVIFLLYYSESEKYTKCIKRTLQMGIAFLSNKRKSIKKYKYQECYNLKILKGKLIKYMDGNNYFVMKL